MQITFSLRNNNLVIDSSQSLDDFSAAFADLTKLKKTHVKSTISKTLGFIQKASKSLSKTHINGTKT